MTPEDFELMKTLVDAEKKDRLTEKGAIKLEELRSSLPGDPGFAKRQAIFAGRGALDTYQGVKQKFANLEGKEQGDAYTAGVNQDLEYYNQLRAAYPREEMVSRFIGNAASVPIAGPAGAIASRIGLGGLFGGVIGGAQFDPQNSPENMRRNALFGAGGAMAMEGAMAGARGLAGAGTQSPRAMPAPTPPAASVAATHQAAGITPRGYEYYDPEFNMPYSEGQWTGDLTRQQIEQRMAHNAFGEAQGADIRALHDYQQRRGTDALMEAGTDFVQGNRTGQLVPEGTQGGREYQTLPEAGARLKSGLSDRANQLWSDIDAAFNAGRGTGQTITVGDANQFVNRMMNSIDQYDRKAIMAAPKQYPAMADVETQLRSFIPEAVEGMPPQAMDVEGLHAMRRILSEARASKDIKPNEARIISGMLDEFDQEVMRLIDNNLIEGGGDALMRIKEGIKLRADYGKLYGPRLKRTRSGNVITDKPGEAIEKIIETDMPGEEVASLVFGKSRLGTSANTREILVRVKRAAGENSDEYQSLRNMALEKLREDVTQAGTDLISPQKLATRWKQLRTKNPALLGELYSNAELGRIDRLVKAVEKTRYKEEAMNRSRSAHMIEAMFNTIPPAIGAAVGGATGGPVGAAGGAVTAYVAAKAGQDIKNVLGKVFATRTYERMPRALPASIGAAAGTDYGEYIRNNPRRTNVNRLGGYQ